jgi:hypothetical protein
MTCPIMLFVGPTPDPPELEKLYINVSCPGCTRPHYVTCKSHLMQKHLFGVTCPDVLFVGSTPGPPKLEKWCVDISRVRRNVGGP